MAIEIKTSNWTKLSMRVVLLFAVTMILTYLPDHLRVMFGDRPNTYNAYSYGGGRWDGTHFLDEQWIWGWRHYLYFWMCMVLFVIQAVRIGVWINNNKFDKA